MSKSRLKTLFQKLGETQVRDILRHFYERMSHDVLIGYFFSGKDVAAIAEKQAQFLFYAAGMHSTYMGKLPASAHLELPPILKGHFDRRLILLRETLANYGLSDEDI